MKKFLKKTIVFAIAAIMMLAMAIPAMADTTTPQLKIEGLAKGDIVNLYRITSPTEDYLNGAAKGDATDWNYATGYTAFADYMNPTEGEISAAANVASGKTADNTATVGDNGVYTYNIDGTKLGTYIAIITSADNASIYNPVLLGASYAGEEIEAGALTFGEDENGKQTLKYSGSATPKKTTTNFDKHIKHWGANDAVDPTGKTTVADEDRPNEEGVKTVSVGDVVEYSVEITVPKYADNAKNQTMFAADTMSAGLTFDDTQFADMTLVLKKAGSEDVTVALAAGANRTYAANQAPATHKFGTYADVKKNGNGWYVNFLYAAVKEFDKVEICYKAVVNDQAIIGSEGNPNDADYYYARNPQNGDTWIPMDKPSDEADEYGHFEDEEIVFTYEITIHKVDKDDATKNLEGAVFEVYDASGNLVDVITTNAQGLATTTKVKAGTYRFKEIKAPTGYAMPTGDAVWTTATANWTSATKTKISGSTEQHYTSEKPSNDAQQVGWIKNGKFYNMTQKPAGVDKAAENPEDPKQEVFPAYATGNAKTESTKTVQSITNETGEPGNGACFVLEGIKNTQTPGLPSTGGMGTYIFTIIGVAVVAIAAGMLIFRRKQA